MTRIASPQIGEKAALVLDIDEVLLHHGAPPPAGYERVPGLEAKDHDSSLRIDIDDLIEYALSHPLEDEPPMAYNTFYSPAHGLWLKSLLPKVEPYYCSTRRSHSHKVIGETLGLPEFDWLDYDVFGARDTNEARRLAVQTFLPERSLVWIDDDLAQAEFEWAEQRSATGTPTLLIKPDVKLGIEPHHMEEVTAWLGELLTISS